MAFSYNLNSGLASSAPQKTVWPGQAAPTQQPRRYDFSAISAPIHGYTNDGQGALKDIAKLVGYSGDPLAASYRQAVSEGYNLPPRHDSGETFDAANVPLEYNPAFTQALQGYTFSPYKSGYADPATRVYDPSGRDLGSVVLGDGGNRFDSFMEVAIPAVVGAGFGMGLSSLAGGAGAGSSLTGAGSYDAYAAMDAAYGGAGAGTTDAWGAYLSNSLNDFGFSNAGAYGGSTIIDPYTGLQMAAESGMPSSSLTGAGSLQSYGAMDAAYGTAGSGGLFSGLGSGASSLAAWAKANPQLASLAMSGAGQLLGGSAGSPPQYGGGLASGFGTGSVLDQQSLANLQAAQLQAQINRPDVITPTGSTKYTIVNDPSVPGGKRYVQTTSLSGNQQNIFNANESAQQNQASMLDALSKRVGGELGTAADFSSVPGLKTSAGDPSQFYQQAADAMYGQQTRYLDPQVKQQQQALEARLSEQGFVPGTPGYKQAMMNFMDTNNRAYAQARDAATTAGVTAGQNLFNNSLANANLNNSASKESLAQLLAKRAQPLNELNAVRSGTQITNPTAPGVAQVSNPAVDVLGATQQQYQNQLGVYNANVASKNSNNQALAQLGLALGMYFGG